MSECQQLIMGVGVVLMKQVGVCGESPNDQAVDVYVLSQNPRT